MGIGEPRTIWKYNAFYHLLSTEHPLDGVFDPVTTFLPKAMTVNMFISQKEERLQKRESSNGEQETAVISNPSHLIK
jgi:hypothetical protein